MIHGADPLDKAFVDETRMAAARAGIQLHVGGVPRPEDLDTALSAMRKAQVGAVIVQGNLPVQARQVAQLAVRHRLPSISLLPQFAESGGLMSYGASLNDIQRHAASYVDKILKGAKPADLPVEPPASVLVEMLRELERDVLALEGADLGPLDQQVLRGEHLAERGAQDLVALERIERLAERGGNRRMPRRWRSASESASGSVSAGSPGSSLRAMPSRPAARRPPRAR